MKLEASQTKRLAVSVGLMILAALVFHAAAAAQPIPPAQIDTSTGKPRVFVISDIGNEPDDQMSLVRFLVYSNEFDVQGLIATTSTWQKTATHPETMHALIHAYGEVRPNLLLHAKGWPTAEDLDKLVASGQPAYGMAATGPGKSSDGSKLIIHAVDAANQQSDPRPIWITVWGGANTLAQALMDAKATHSPEEMKSFVARLRVYSISDQDDAGPWIRREFPDLFYIVQPSAPNSGEYAYATWTGISGDKYYRNGAGADFSVVTNEWLETNIRSKGPLGKAYPKWMFIMEGDTPSYLSLIDNGLNSYRRPDWGGWGGRYLYRQPYGETHPIWTQGGDEFLRVTSSDTVTGIDGVEHVSDQATIWRWRRAFQNDFAARMDWTIRDFAHANHNPIVTIDGNEGTAPIYIDAEVGKPISLDAAKSHDPDGQPLHFQWFHYAEAGLTGSNYAAISIAGADTPKATITPTAACRDAWIPGMIPCKGDGIAHIILAVTDEGSPQLTSYRRVILTVHPAQP